MIHSVFTPRILPPKEDKPFTPPPPGFLFADAKRCNSRMKQKPLQTPRTDAARALSEKQKAKSTATEDRCHGALVGQMSARQIAKIVGMSREGVRLALHRLEDRGLVVKHVRYITNVVWERKE